MIRFVTYHRFPNLSPDDRPLADALRRRGVDVQPACWDDPGIDWAQGSLTILRSPWDYHQRPGTFLAWVRRAAGATVLINSCALVEWNLHKQYLAELTNAGIRTVPTRLLRRGTAATLAEVIEASGWDDVVVKPAISASSYRTMRVREASRASGDAARHLRGLLADVDVLVQRYVPAVETRGERALVFIDGAFTHAFAKTPFDTTYPEEDGAIGTRIDAAADEVAFGREVLARLPEPPVYARIDIVPGDGGPTLMEVELIDPSLHFRVGPEAVEAMTRSLLARLADISSAPSSS